jgi:hypothetical protein
VREEEEEEEEEEKEKEKEEQERGKDEVLLKAKVVKEDEEEEGMASDVCAPGKERKNPRNNHVISLINREAVLQGRV